MFKGAVFDLDGVVVDTVPLHFKAWQKMFSEYGVKFEMKDYLAKVDGRPRVEGAAAILTGLSADEINKAGEKKQSYFMAFLKSEPIVVFDSTVKLIREMKKRKIKLAAASSSKNAAFILRKIGLYDVFDANVSGQDFKRGKPDPEIFLMAAGKLGLASSECVVFEDAQSGVEAARAGGFHCVGIDRHDNPKPLAGADIIVKDLSEVKIEQIAALAEGSS